MGSEFFVNPQKGREMDRNVGSGGFDRNIQSGSDNQGEETRVSTDPLPESPFVKKPQLWLVALLVFALTLGSVWGLSFTGAFDGGSGFDGVSVEGDMNEHVRQVRLEATAFYTVEELKSVFRASTPGFANAPEDVREEVEEAWDEQLAELVNEDGLIPQDSLAPQFQLQTTNGFGVLIDDHVVVSSNLAAQVLNVPASSGDRVQVTVSLLPDPDVDDVDDWKVEELFSGTASEFATSSDVLIETESSLVYFERPNVKEFADSNGEFHRTVGLSEVEELSTVVFPSVLGPISTSESGEVVGTVEDRGFILARGAFAVPGTPVFLVGDDGELVFAGIFVGAAGGGLGAVISSDVVFDNLPEKGEEQ